MRIIFAFCLALFAAGCANRLDPVFDGGVYEPIYGATEAGAAQAG